MQLDVRITGGILVDGTGGAPRRADLGIREGRVVAIGRDAEVGATKVIDASDQVVAPGFVDVHTHYDAQVLWDPTLSPSVLHGVTTVVAGNCGLTLGPVAPGDEEFLTRLLARVEAIPVEALQIGVTYRWRTFAEYLDVVASSPLAINLGFLVGHSALRRAAMGEAASEVPATPSQLEVMREMLGDALAAGAMGFSSSTSPTQFDGDGRPSPPNYASNDELIALARVCRQQPGTSLEFVPSTFMQGFSDEHLRLMGDMSSAADRHLNWNSVIINQRAPELHERQVASADVGRDRGGCVVPMVIPHNFRMRTDFLDSDVGFRAVQGWDWLFELTRHERRQALADPAARDRLAGTLAASDSPMTKVLREELDTFLISDTGKTSLAPLVGRRLSDVALERGMDDLATAFSLAVEADLEIGFVRHMLPPSTPELRELRMRVLRDPRVMLGASDGGAHVRSFVNAEYPTQSFDELVRELEVFTVAELVHELADVPARLYGLTDRGRLIPGAIADIVVFDPQAIASGPVGMVDDLPGGASRLLSAGVGISAVLVSGREVVRDGALTGELPGKVLRSGRDTHTVSVADAQRLRDR